MLKKKKLKSQNRTRGTKIDWTTLQKGDIIRAVSGGPYYIVASTGEKVCVGCKGLFRVQEVDDEGVHAYVSGTKKSSGHSYIYMGEKRQLNTGTFLMKHKILLIQRS